MANVLPRVLVLAALAVAAGCGSGGGEDRPEVQRYYYADASDTRSVKASVERTLHADGTEELRGRTVHDVAVYMRTESIEHVVLAPDGRLVSADLHYRNRTGAVVHEKRVIYDPEAGTVSVTRPSGHTLWTLDAGLPWSFYSMWSDPWWRETSATPISGWAYARARYSFDPIRYIAHDVLLQLELDGLGGGVPAQWNVYEDLYAFDPGDDFVTEFYSDLAGGWIERVEEEPEGLPEFEVAEGTNPIPFPECKPEGTARNFVTESADGTPIHGVLNMPPSVTGPIPFVVINSGTGGTDREGELGAIPRWRCLATPLVAAGIAVVRYDDRGHGVSTFPLSDVTFTHRSEDAAAVAAWAAARPEVAPAGLFLLGHSEGAAHASDAAVVVTEVDGLILVGGIGSRGREALKEQIAQIVENYGYPDDFARAVDEAYEAFLMSVEDGTFEGLYNDLSQEYWREFFVFDGSEKARAAARPTLVAHGGRDWRVDVSHAEVLASAVKSAGVADVTTRIYPDDGHMMIPVAPDFVSCGDEESLPIDWNPAFVGDLVEWIDARR